jgi:hypothetical protein
VQELPNQHRKLDILTAVLAVGPACLLGAKRRKLGFPIPQCMRFDADDVGNLTDLEEELVRELGAPRHE